MRSRLERHDDCSGGSTAWAVGLVGCLLVVGALFVGAAPAMAGGSLSETGDVCGNQYAFGSCTAGDVNITSLDATPVDGDDCDNAADTILVTFTIGMENVSNATRHDPAYYVALDGGSGETGDMCLHGALAPGQGIDSDMDSCFDLNPSAITSVQTVQVTLSCTDDDLDGFLDDINICSSAKTPGNDSQCDDVIGAFAAPGSKCECSDVELTTPIPVPGFCAADDECGTGISNNGLICDGEEICDAENPNADGFGCVVVAAPDCSGLNDQCNDGVCNEGTGACEADPKPLSTPCDDDNVCTSETGDEGTADHCDGAGQCTGVPVDCSGLDDQCNDGVCNEGTGACEADPKPLSTPCDDDNVCTSETGDEGTADHCDGAGQCTGVPVDCSGLDDQCNDGVCNASGACEADPKPLSTTCEDGNVCTSETGDEGTADHCDGAGECTGVPVDCSGLDDQCNDGVCNASGACEADPKPLSTTCEDGNVCTSETGDEGTADHCDGAGECTGVPVDCSGLDDQCNDGVCNASGACEADPKPLSTTCEDGNVCTSETGDEGTADHCDGAGECTGVPVDCSGLDDQCNDGVCNASGACEAIPDEGRLCNDSEDCTDDDACTSNGICVGDPVTLTLTVIKDVINDDGFGRNGGLEAGDFALDLFVDGFFDQSFLGSSSGTDFTYDDAVSFEVREDLTDQGVDLSPFYAVSFDGCDGGLSCAGTRDAACTVTNDDVARLRGSISVLQDEWLQDSCDLSNNCATGSFTITNVSSGGEDVLITDQSVRLDIKRVGQRKGKFQLLDADADCTFDPDALFTVSDGSPQEVTFECDLSSYGLTSGDTLKVTAEVNIFQQHKATFTSSYTKQLP